MVRTRVRTRVQTLSQKQLYHIMVPYGIAIQIFTLSQKQLEGTMVRTNGTYH